MKINDLDMHCGCCGVIGFCGEPFSELCLCKDSRFKHLTESQYINLAEKANINNPPQEEDYEDEEKCIEALNIMIADEIYRMLKRQKKVMKEHFGEEETGLKDYKCNSICLNDKVSIYGLDGVVVKEYGAYGIAFAEAINWDVFCSMIEKETGCDNSPDFCYNDIFVSFWEIVWNYNCEENYLPMVKIIN